MSNIRVCGITPRAILAALAIFCVTPALSQTDSMFSPYQRYEDALLDDDLDAAAGFAQQSVSAATAEFGAESPEVVEALIRLATVNQQLGHLDEAERNLEQALRITEQALGDQHPELVPLLEFLATINREQGDLDNAAARIARVLSIELAIYGEHSDIVVTTLGELRDIYEESGQTDKQLEMEARIRAAGEFTRNLGSLDDDDPRRYSAKDGYATVRVFYGTNRVASGKSKPAQFYGNRRGELDVGYVDVSIPETHKYGELESESRFSIYTYLLGDEAKKRRYVILQSVVPLDQEDYYAQLSSYIEDSPSNDVFVFIHGFNVTFEDAARRAAQLAYDLDFDGTPMVYSWPSKASAVAYTVDEAVVRPSGRKLARLLDGIVHETGAERIHLVAHSMGNRALIEALQAYILRNGTEESLHAFDQIVFTAPDVDRDYFLETVDSVSSVARRVTLYASRNDLALKASRLLHGATRAGLAGGAIISHPAIDTIDVSGIDADILGHSYFAANEGAIYDLFRLFWHGEPPPERCSMSEKETRGARFWLFDLDNCRGSDLLEAGLLYRKFGDNAVQRVEQHIEEIEDDEDEDKEEWTGILDRLHSLIDESE